MASNAKSRDPTLVEQIETLNDHLEELATAGEWQQIYELLPRRNAMLLELDQAEQIAALMAAQRSTEKLGAMAYEARHQVAGKITDLARGKKATDSYRSHS